MNNKEYEESQKKEEENNNIDLARAKDFLSWCKYHEASDATIDNAIATVNYIKDKMGII